MLGIAFNQPATNNNTEYLKEVQYANPDHLSARVRFYRGCSTNEVGFPDFLFNLILECAGTKTSLLEVGAGTGNLWAGSRCDKTPAEWQLYLTDVSEAYVGHLAKSSIATRTGVTFCVADVQALPFNEGQFDIVVAMHMLYHARDIEQSLVEIKRVMRPGGMLIASTM